MKGEKRESKSDVERQKDGASSMRPSADDLPKMSKQIVTMPDGRYMIFYTFSTADAPDLRSRFSDREAGSSDQNHLDV